MSKDLPLIHEMNSDETQLVNMLNALGNPVRFSIMEYLASHQLCITNDIVEFTTLAQSTISQHLMVLRKAGLIKGDIKGPATSYCINEKGLEFLKNYIDNWLANF